MAATHICQDTSYNARLEALRSGPYGRCVFRCDNDVMDRQSAVFQLEGGATATFNAIGLSSENTRVIRLFGSQGELYGSLTEDRLTLTSFSTGRREVFDTSDPSNSSYHGGGDYSLTEDFLNAVATGRRELKTSAVCRSRAILWVLRRRGAEKKESGWRLSQSNYEKAQKVQSP